MTLLGEILASVSVIAASPDRSGEPNHPVRWPGVSVQKTRAGHFRQGCAPAALVFAAKLREMFQVGVRQSSTFAVGDPYQIFFFD